MLIFYYAVIKYLIFLGLSKGTQGPSRHIIKNQYQGLEFDGEVFFTNSLLPQSMTILHSALQKDSFLGNEKIIMEMNLIELKKTLFL